MMHTHCIVWLEILIDITWFIVTTLIHSYSIEEERKDAMVQCMYGTVAYT